MNLRRLFARPIGRSLAAPRLQGVRFRLAAALSVALLPILVLAVFQARDQFIDQDQERREDLQLAAERTASSVRGRLDSTTVLLQALRPGASEPFCAARLEDLVERVEGVDGLARLTATGATVCASSGLTEAPPAWLAQARTGPWFQRLRQGEETVLARAPAGPGQRPGLIVATRLERPLGRFDGATLALIPLDSLQPDVADRALPEGSEAALTDADGRLLAATNVQAFRVMRGDPVEGWVTRARADGSALFEGDVDGLGHRVYAGAALAGRDVYVVLSAPAPGLFSWARLNPVGVLGLPLLAWLAAFAAVMWVSERMVVRWLVYLERVAAIYARGRFTVRPVQAMNAPAEIRVLAQTLDDLADGVTRRDAALTASLAEKDGLMREIHHRVKNNLQIISSLLSMQQRSVTDEAARAALGDTRQRISALAQIYRTLYQSDDLRYADAKIFISELVGQLIAADAARGQVTTTSIEADSLVVDPDKLAPLALWLVEAVSNAQKHAFAGRGGDLKVRFRVNGETSVLEVEDDGPGVTESLKAGVGRTLMGAFAKQLRGEADMIRSEAGGSIARLTFATPEAITPHDPADLGTAPAPPR